MYKNQHPEKYRKGKFNTLGESGTTFYNKPAIIVNGSGTDLANRKALKGRAKRKMITQKMVLSLIDVCDKNSTPDRKKAYWNTFNCQSKIYSGNGRLYGKYCKNRFCTLCCSIRKAEIINNYMPIIQAWPDPYFVTLTIKSQPLRNLNKFMRGMIKAFRRINEKYRKRSQRGNGIKLVGIKSLECNFNPRRKEYNPHFHLIVPNQAIAKILLSEWLTIWTAKYTDIKGQKIEPIYNKQSALIELIKYGSKIFTEPDVNKKLKSKGKSNIHAAALENIFIAMKGLRIFERFGFNLPNESEKVRQSATVIQKYDEWEFVPKVFDWVNPKNDQTLSEYKPAKDLLNMLENNIDTVLQ